MRGAAVLAACAARAAAGARPWMNPKDTPEERAKKLVAEMTTDEKLSLFHGSCKGYVGNVCGIPRVGIPQQKFNDGPQGFRGKAGTSTNWPAAITVAASFDTEQASTWGTAMGDEFYRKGANVQLGPGMCLARVPRNGRNFEYLSGEDPYLGYHMVGPVISGIQSQGVIANAKHWVNNNQESGRGSETNTVDERTEFEMYYPPFEGAINAGLGSIMCSYNKICKDCPHGKIGNWSCENSDTLKTDLKERLGFKGWVMSDWGATHSASIMRGLDQEMPGSGHMGDTLAGMVKSGEVPMSQVDDSAFRILWPYFAVGLFDKNNTNSLNNDVTSDAHNALARSIAAAGTVLLKNDGVLPLSTAAKVAVIGGEGKKPTCAGGGSGHVQGKYCTTPLDGVNGKLTAAATYDDGSDTGRAAKLAAASDVAIVFAGTSSSEGRDRGNLGLGSYDALITAVAAAAGKKTVVVAVTPGALLTPWRGDVAGVITPMMPGQEYGHAIADVLFGDVNPSGRLPVTFPGAENEMKMSQDQWPGTSGVSDYSEKLEVGYRWYAAHGVKPAFPFGHGLSYTTFKYSDLSISGRTVSCTIANTGKSVGKEVVQLYLKFPDAAGEPPKQLKGFTVLSIAAGASSKATVTLDDRSFSIWDASKHAWSVVKGDFGVMVGASSEDIRLTGTVSS